MLKAEIKVVYSYIEVDSPLEEFLLKRGFTKVGFYKNRFGLGKDANILEKYL